MPRSSCTELDESIRTELLAIARRSIEAGPATDSNPGIDLDRLDETLRVHSAVFVTLTQAGVLRGCVGSLEARDSLAQAVSRAAFNAAYRDPRFPPLESADFCKTRIEISVLSPFEAVVAPSRQALLDELRPGVDGLVIEDAGRRATFLPKVWEKIASPEDFLQQLFLKAGLSPGHWSERLVVKRYTTETFAEAVD